MTEDGNKVEVVGAVGEAKVHRHESCVVVDKPALMVEVE